LAQRLHAPAVVLVYESGTIDVHPGHLPLSVADDGLAGTARTIVSVPEMFAYWLQPGRFELGILGAGQVDRFANINSTVIGPYDRPTVRLPGAGGAPEIAAACAETVVLARQSRRTFVERVDFVSTFGHGDGPGQRERLGMRGAGPVAVITDIGVLEPDPVTRELTLTQLHPGMTVAHAREATGWDLAVANAIATTAGPTDPELAILRALDPAGTRA
jgi:glutaconate CoA-transferase subunit B